MHASKSSRSCFHRVGVQPLGCVLSHGRLRARARTPEFELWARSQSWSAAFRLLDALAAKSQRRARARTPVSQTFLSRLDLNSALDKLFHRVHHLPGTAGAFAEPAPAAIPGLGTDQGLDLVPDVGMLGPIAQAAEDVQHCCGRDRYVPVRAVGDEGVYRSP